MPILLVVAALLFSWTLVDMAVLHQHAVRQAARADRVASELLAYHQASSAWMALHPLTPDGLLVPPGPISDDPNFAPTAYGSFVSQGVLFTFIWPGVAATRSGLPGVVDAASDVGKHLCLSRSDGTPWADCQDGAKRRLPTFVATTLQGGDLVIAGDLP
jgi:hypothetical protein